MDESHILKETLENIDKYIESQKEAIELGKDLEFLMNTKQFKNVVLNGYIDTEAKKLFEILIDPSGASPYTDEVIQLKLAAISDFKGYIGTEDYPGTIKINAKNAPYNIDREEQERTRVTAEYAESRE